MMLLRMLSLICLLAIRAQAQPDDSYLLYDDTQVARYDISVDPATLQWMYENVQSDSMHLAQLHMENLFLDEQVDDVGFRLRGNTSREARKKSFKISFNDFVQGREVHGVDKLNLNGEHNDPSITRSKLCFDLYQRIGKIASRASHGEVWINGDYFGLYVSVEHVDDEFLWKHFDHADGNLWKCLWPADLAWRGSSPEDYKQESDGRRVYELTTNEEGDDYSALFRLIRILHETPNFAIEDSLDNFLDVAGVLEYLAVNILVGGWDDYWYLNNNYYLYHDPVTDRMTLIPYDYDNTFGVDWFGVDWAERSPYNWGSSARPLADRILARPRWRNLFTHMLQHHLEHASALEAWPQRLDPLRQLITPSAAADSFRTLDYNFTMDDFTTSWGESYQNQHVRRGILEFIERRVETLPGQLAWQNTGPVVYALEAETLASGPGDSLRIDAAAFHYEDALTVQLRWRVLDAVDWNLSDMVFTGEPDAPILRLADRWSATLPPQPAGTVLELQAVATDDQTRSHRFPPVRPLRVSWREESTLRLNEFLALNEDGITDPSGEHEDWVELVNIGTEPVALAGLYMSDDFDNPTDWVFPNDTPPLQPGGFLLVWCDEDEDQPGLHADFKLSGNGEAVVLTAADGISILDSLTFGPQQDDISQGRLPDGSGGWQPMTPTPGATNSGTALPERPLQPAAWSIRAWPNPFNGAMRLTLAGLNGEVKVEVFNLTGERLHVISTIAHSGQPLDLTLGAELWDGLPSGIFLVHARAGFATQDLRVLHLK